MRKNPIIDTIIHIFRKNEYFLVSLLIFGFFAINYLGGWVSVWLYLMPFSTYALALFYYVWEENLLHSNYKNLVIAVQPLGNERKLARIMSLSTILQFGTYYLLLRDSSTHLSVIHSYAMYYILLSATFWVAALIGLLMVLRSDPMILIYPPLTPDLLEHSIDRNRTWGPSSRDALPLQVSIQKRGYSLFLYIGIIVIFVLTIIHAGISLRIDQTAPISRQGEFHEILWTTPSGDTFSLQLSSFLQGLFFFGISLVIGAMALRYWLYSTLSIPQLTQFFHTQGITNAHFLLSLIQRTLPSVKNLPESKE